jgi:hypothetical protein
MRRKNRREQILASCSIRPKGERPFDGGGGTSPMLFPPRFSPLSRLRSRIGLKTLLSTFPPDFSWCPLVPEREQRMLFGKPAPRKDRGDSVNFKDFIINILPSFGFGATLLEGDRIINIPPDFSWGPIAPHLWSDPRPGFPPRRGGDRAVAARGARRRSRC